MMAIANNHIDVARLLLDHGADVNAVDWWGRTPLWTAVDLRDLEVNKTDDNGVDRPAALQLIQALLDRGANVNAEPKKCLPCGAGSCRSAIFPGWMSPAKLRSFARLCRPTSP